ncbi:GNAT family N-acetyltransferase [Microlunatus elymi]|uniref:GNAT family N-acetyltransferase n=1 Tax=Microlunatus elymi TaxID=2596828 RepID=A0A516Q0U5_9ACTN|nr:GNAT family N-acetyltransferase [Microlunatus elymi]QDP96831.1 GNAT family N-acetyltransferase [Microlunatus elymi]
MARRESRPERIARWALYVRAEVYGRGVGHALLNQAIGSAAAYLWVLDGNTRAIRFYRRQGFQFDGRSKTEPVGGERRMVRGEPGDGRCTHHADLNRRPAASG